MTTLQQALDYFESRARAIGQKVLTESSDGQPFTILSGDETTGLRLTWSTQTFRFTIAITNGPRQGGTDWLDLYDMVISDTDMLPADNDVSVTDAIDYGTELMSPYRNAGNDQL